MNMILNNKYNESFYGCQSERLQEDLNKKDQNFFELWKNGGVSQINRKRFKFKVKNLEKNCHSFVCAGTGFDP